MKTFSLTLALLAFCIILLTGGMRPAAGQDGGQRYVASDGTVSRRLDLREEDDRRLLASLIRGKEGRVYAFEKMATHPKAGKRRLDLSSPQIFDLGTPEDADRLAAAISNGRSTFFIARPTLQQAETATSNASASALVAERLDRYLADGQVGRRVDLHEPLDRLRLAASISKRDGRVYSFKKGEPITGKPDVFDLAKGRDADRLMYQISGAGHVFFMVDHSIPETVASAEETDGRPEQRGASEPATGSSKTAVGSDKEDEDEGLGGPIQLFPSDRNSEDFTILASDDGIQSDADAPLIDVVDEPTGTANAAGASDDDQTDKPVDPEDAAPRPSADKVTPTEPEGAFVVAALTGGTGLSEEEPQAKRPEKPAPRTAPRIPTTSRTTKPVEQSQPAAPSAPRDEAEVIAALEQERQVGAGSVVKDESKASAARSGGVVAVDAPKQTLDLAIGEGKLVRLSEPIAKLLIADPGVADAQVMSDDLIYIFGNELGQTNIFGLTDDERVSADFDVRIGSNVAGARARLKELQPDSMADFARVGGRVVAQGLVRDPSEAYQVATLGDAVAGDGQPALNNTVMPGAQQVNIRVRFAEVSRNDIARLGMNWEAILDSGDFLFGLASGNLFLPDGLGGVDSTESFGSIFGSASFGDFNLDIFLEGLEREGIVNVLAEPNLTAINGRPANFLAGGEIPIPVPQSEGIITIDYKPFGVSLEFLPTLLPGNRINLQVRPEVSSIVSNGGVVLQGFNIPAFTVRRAETAIELASGQTFAIAGLFQRSVTSDIDKFPVVGDVPVIGNLFKSPRFQRSETELVILITPYLVEPARSANLTVPNQRVDRSVPPVEPRQPASGLGGFIID